MKPKLAVLDPVAAVTVETLSAAPAPLWAPWPLLNDWVFSGLAYGGSPENDGSTVTCWSGPDPFGDPAEMLLISEEAGAGVGSYFADLAVSYPGPGVGEGSPHARFTVKDRVVPLWAVDGAPPDRAVYAGEAAGRWLWVVVHPSEAGTLMVEPVQLVDARDLGAELAVLPVGELSPRLVVGD